MQPPLFIIRKIIISQLALAQLAEGPHVSRCKALFRQAFFFLNTYKLNWTIHCRILAFSLSSLIATDCLRDGILLTLSPRTEISIYSLAKFDFSRGLKSIFFLMFHLPSHLLTFHVKRFRLSAWNFFMIKDSNFPRIKMMRCTYFIYMRFENAAQQFERYQNFLSFWIILRRAAWLVIIHSSSRMPSSAILRNRAASPIVLLPKVDRYLRGGMSAVSG